jgi:hypothetical protein
MLEVSPYEENETIDLEDGDLIVQYVSFYPTVADGSAFTTVACKVVVGDN